MTHTTSDARKRRDELTAPQAGMTPDRLAEIRAAAEASPFSMSGPVLELVAEVERLTEALPKRTNDWLAHCKRLDAERDAVSDQLCKAWKELGEAEAERDAARAEVQRMQVEIEETRAAWWELTEKDAALRERIAGLAEECEKVPPANEAMNAWQRAHAAFARALRALLDPAPPVAEERGQ